MTRRRWDVTLLLLAVASLTGCAFSPSPGGQTAAEAVEQLEAREGVAGADVRVSETLSGSTTRHHAWLEIDLEPGYAPGLEPEAALDYLLRTVWSITDEPQPDVSITIALRDAATGSPIAWDAEGAAQSLGIERGLSVDEESISVNFRVADVSTGLGELLGPWPGHAPPPPPTVFARSEGEGIEDLTATLREIPGVADAEVRLDVGMNGFTQHRTAVVAVTLTEGADLGVPEQDALAYFLRLAWAIGEGEPNATIVIALRDAEGIQLSWDVEAAATALGIVDGVSVRELSTSLWFDRGGEPTGLAEFLGPWPGHLPTAPDGLFTTTG